MAGSRSRPGYCDAGERVILVRHEYVPVVQQVSTRLAEFRLGQCLASEPECDPAQPAQRPRKMLLPQGRTAVADLGFVPFVLESVQSADKPQDQRGRLAVAIERFVEVAPCVRPAE